MDERIRQLLAQITELEDELRHAMRERESQVLFHFKGRRATFEESVRRRHRELRTGLLRWWAESRPQNWLSAPFIYAMIVPFMCLDIGVTIYQAVCFPLYGIPKVRRRDYIAFDRHRLGYLNVLEKFHCEYCAYGNGLLAYATEITARTEQYWCPIKHAHRVLGTHARYQRFMEFGAGEQYQAYLETCRQTLQAEASAKPPSDEASGR